jgi:lipoprotein-releasing system permease protein
MMFKRLINMLPIEFYIASRYVTANVRQSLIIMLAVGIGVALIIFIPSINLSFFQYFLSETVENSPHINLTRELETMARNKQVLSPILRLTNPNERVLFSDQTETRRRNVTAYRRLTQEVEQFPGVTAVSPFVREQVIVVHGAQNRSASLRGFIPEREEPVTHISDDVVEGQLQSMGPSDVFLGTALAEELGVGVGDRVQLLTAFGERSYKVAGLVKTGIYQQDLTTVILNLQAAQRLLQMNNEVTGLGVKIRDIYDAERIARIMAETYNLKARSWMEENKIFLDQIGNFRVIIAVINFLIVFAAATSITSILIMVVASKSKEIGILKAMGTRPAAIMRLFISQGIFLSLFGMLAGFFGALALIAIYNASPAGRGETIIGIERQPTTLNMEYTILAFIYAFITSILASTVPAWQASRLDPVKAINQ